MGDHSPSTSSTNKNPGLRSLFRARSSSESHQLKGPLKYNDHIQCKRQKNTKSHKRAFSDTELGDLTEVLKDYQDFTPLQEKRDILSTRLKRHKVIQKEIAHLTTEISTVQIDKNDS
jgi:hypothetical protein